MGDSELLHADTKKTLTEALTQWFTKFSQSFFAVKIGKITAVNYSNQTVDVQVMHKMKDDTFPTLNKLRDYPLLTKVPFVVLGGGNSHITFPIAVGDYCLLFFCDYEIDRWWLTGEGQPSVIDRRHNISDAFALVGVHSMIDLIQGYSNYVELKYSDSSKITVGNNITLDNALVNTTGDVTAEGVVTGAELIAENGYTGTVVVGSKTLTFVSGILISVT